MVQAWRQEDAAAPLRARIAALVAGASLEVTAKPRAIAAALAAPLAKGTSVYITALADDTAQAMVAAAAELRRAGLEPVPHLGARYFADRAALDDVLARLRGEAGVEQVLAIGGDIARPRGPFQSSHDLIATGLLERHGIARVGLAGYPEGHPRLAPERLDEERALKIARLKAVGIAPYIVTQFCFDAVPIRSFLARHAARHPEVPVHLGLAGPAKLATLLNYAASCGIGASLGALRRNGAMTRLFVESGPEPVITALAQDEASAARIARLHFFTFGGFRRTARWAAAIAEGAFALDQGGARFRVTASV